MTLSCRATNSISMRTQICDKYSAILGDVGTLTSLTQTPLLQSLLNKLVSLRFLIDSRRMNVELFDRQQYRTIQMLHLTHRLSFPRLQKPSRFSDFIPLELLAGRDERVPTLVDKLALKDNLPKLVRVDATVFPRTLSSLDYLRPEDFDAVSYPCVVKCNHDSGTSKVLLVKPTHEEARMLADFFNKRASMRFGEQTGEWFYDRISPRIYFEQYVGDGQSIRDYKFHCVRGEVVFCQIIWDRHLPRPRELIVFGDSTAFSSRLDQDMVQASRGDHNPRNWEAMLLLASRISSEFRYVRVDLYDSETGPKVGELTFSPRAGNYRGRGNRQLGRMICDRLYQ